MKLWVGLGNPGASYARNRHNAGFMALDRIAADYGFSPWKKGFNALVAEGRLAGGKVLLLKPQTFMNLSGQSVGEAMRFHRLQPVDVTVFHDELDLAPGRVRVKSGGGHAGHNGLRSIHAHLGEAYHRVRIGIGHPGHKEAVAGYVLHDFAKAEEGLIDDVLRGISEGAEALGRGDTGGFLNAVALRVAPPRSGGGAEAAEGRPASRPAPAAAAPASGPPAGAPDAPAPDIADPRSILRRLADRFR